MGPLLPPGDWRGTNEVRGREQSARGRVRVVVVVGGGGGEDHSF